MKGLDKFLAARKNGILLSREVLLWFGCNPLTPKKYLEDLTCITEGAVESHRDDFRVVVGLDVILCCERITDEVSRIHDALKRYAKSLMLVSMETKTITLWKKETQQEVAL